MYFQTLDDMGANPKGTQCVKAYMYLITESYPVTDIVVVPINWRVVLGVKGN